MKLPFIQFFPADYQRDTRALSLATKGGWVDIFCELHHSSTRGRKRLPVVGWARIMGATVDQADAVIKELEDTETAEITRDPDGVTISCRRMLREFKDREGNKERQQRFRANTGGDPEAWAEIRVEILDRDKHTCAYCGREARTMDRVNGIESGNAKTNLVACCYRCNRNKRGRSQEDARMPFWQGFDASVLNRNGESNAETNASVTGQSTDNRVQKTEDRSNPPEGAAPALAGLADDTSPIVFSFPCVGQEPVWHLREAFLARLHDLYKPLDVRAQCKLALAKIERRAVTRKTARGMPKFLFSWMDRATNRHPGNGGGGGKSAGWA